MDVRITSDDHIYKRELEVSLKADEIADIVAKQRKKLQQRAEVPGFRKGKAPMGMVEKRFGGSLLQDVIDTVVNEFYPKAITESKLEPVAQGEIRDLNYEEIGGDFSFTVYTEVEPEIEIKDFKKLKFNRKVRNFRDKDLEDYIAYVREDKAEAVPVTDALQENDIVVCDLHELDQDGNIIPEKHYHDIRAKLGTGQLDPEIEKEMVGMKVGEEKEVVREYPKDFEDKQLAGKTERFQIKVTAADRQKLPEFDAEFVKGLGDFKDVEEFKAKITENIKREFDREAENSLTTSVIDSLIAENPFEVPEKMVDHELELMYLNVKSRGQQIDEGVFKQYYRDAADRNARWKVIRKALLKKNPIEVGDDDIRAYLEKEGWDKNRLDEVMGNDYFISQVRNQLLEQKVIDHISATGKVVDEDVTPEEPGKKAAPKKKTTAKKTTAGKSKTAKKEEK